MAGRFAPLTNPILNNWVYSSARVIAALFALSVAAGAATLNATFNAAGDVAVTASGYTATGNTVDFTLNFAPAPGTELRVVRNTAADFIAGSFGNLAQGQVVPLGFGGNNSSNNSMVPVAVLTAGTPLAGRRIAALAAGAAHCAALRDDGTLVTWGDNSSGQLGHTTTTVRTVPVGVVTAGTPLAGRTAVNLIARKSRSR